MNDSGKTLGKSSKYSEKIYNLLKKSAFFLPFFSGYVVISAPRFLAITNVSTNIIYFAGENYLVSLSICLSYKKYLYNNVNLLHFLNIVAKAKMFVLVHFNFTCACALKTPRGLITENKAAICICI